MSFKTAKERIINTIQKTSKANEKDKKDGEYKPLKESVRKIIIKN